MICKDEAHVIERALASVREKIAYWVIIDTGSTDGTPEIVARAMEGVPGLFLRRPWKNFGHNRTEALDHCHARGDHALILDADDIIEGDFPVLDENTSYSLEVAHGNLRHFRPHLLSLRWGWRYEGAVHESAVCHSIATHAAIPLEGVTYRVKGGGARSSKGSEKFLEDAEMLLEVHRKDPTHARTVFYLAQSCRDAGMTASAVEWYRKRADMGGWPEEAYQAAYEAAKLAPSLEAFWSAWEMRPTRAEPLVAGAAWARNQGRFHLALAMLRAVPRPTGEDRLFVEPDAYYGWRYADERAVAEYWAGTAEEAWSWADTALFLDPPEDQIPRLKQNLLHAEARQQQERSVK